MIAFSPLKLALHAALFFIGGLQTRPIMHALIMREPVRAIEVAAVCGLLFVAVIGLTQGKRVAR